MEYRELTPAQINRALFAAFQRRQKVCQCWRKIDGAWCIKDIAFVDDWSEADYATLVSCLKETLHRGGLVIGAFENDALKGFASVEGTPIGIHHDYLDLSSLHVSQELRGRGIGKELFLRACAWAKAHNAQKLYISAHSAVETQAFYRAMGCVEAKEYNPEHVAAEPCDCQMECPL